MKKFLKKFLPPFIVVSIYQLFRVKNLFLYPKFFKDYFRFRKLYAKGGGPPVNFRDVLPKVGEATVVTDFDHHYIYHPAWAARVLSQTKPAVHTDISSILSFSAIISAFLPVKFYDYRPAKLLLSNLECGYADLTGLPFADASISSLSCMHTVEHIGLGRYGDNLDAQGDVKAINELKRVLASGGNLLFAVPIGKPKVVFNAHRIYSYRQIMEYFSGLELKQFSLIPDASYGNDFIEHATQQQADGQVYGCGCFWFIKK